MLKIQHRQHDYRPVLEKLGLQSLSDRRVIANLTFLCKLIVGSIDCPVLLGKINFKVPSYPSRSCYPFYIPHCTTNYSRNQLIFRMMRIANEDPSFLFS